MRILSYNVRGLGGKANLRVIRQSVIKEEIQFLCIQETKKEDINQDLCGVLWGD